MVNTESYPKYIADLNLSIQELNLKIDTADKEIKTLLALAKDVSVSNEKNKEIANFMQYAINNLQNVINEQSVDETKDSDPWGM